MRPRATYFAVLSSVLWSAAEGRASCHVGIPDDCPLGQVCAKYNSAGESKCFAIPKPAPIVFDLPFDSRSPVVCTQSGRFSNATHIFHNMLYAIDLATPYQYPASIVRAAAPGRAFVYADCKDPPGRPEQTKIDSCGMGYGNHVRILHEGGYISLYAHLTQVSVKNGDRVTRGQKIGLEGATGQAAHRHLHWDVQRLEVPKAQWESYLANPGFGGVSVPYRFKVRINCVTGGGCTEKIVRSDEIACQWLDMKQAPWSGAY